MKKLLLALMCTAGLAACFEQPSPATAAPEAGDPAPSFSLKGSDGRTYSLDDFRGRRAVVIAWFPKAFTGG